MVYRPGVTTSSETQPGPSSLAWWVRDDQGRLTLGQWPNPAIGVWLVAKILAWTDLLAISDDRLADVGRGALLVWSLDELLRGASPFRRLLGAVVLVAQVWLLLS